MKFKDMPYERIDFNRAEQELKTLISQMQEAKSGEEQFALHQKFYKLNDRVQSNYD